MGTPVLKHLAGKKETHCRETSDVLRGAGFPSARFQFGFGLQRHLVFHLKMPDLWKIGVVALGGVVVGLRHRPLHVRLPGTQPHIPHQQVVYFHLARSRCHRHFVGDPPASMGRNLTRQRPVALALVNCVCRAKDTSTRLAWGCPPPDGKIFLPLQHGVIRKEAGQTRSRRDGKRQPQKSKKQIVVFHKQF